MVKNEGNFWIDSAPSLGPSVNAKLDLEIYQKNIRRLALACYPAAVLAPGFVFGFKVDLLEEAFWSSWSPA